MLAQLTPVILMTTMVIRVFTQLLHVMMETNVPKIHAKQHQDVPMSPLLVMILMIAPMTIVILHLDAITQM